MSVLSSQVRLGQRPLRIRSKKQAAFVVSCNKDAALAALVVVRWLKANLIYPTILAKRSQALPTTSPQLHPIFSNEINNLLITLHALRRNKFSAQKHAIRKPIYLKLLGSGWLAPVCPLAPSIP